MKTVPAILFLIAVVLQSLANNNFSDQINSDIQVGSELTPVLVQDELSFILSSKYSYEVIYLLNQLRPREVKTQSTGTIILVPDRDVQAIVSLRLREIARQSPEERAMVIKALAQVVDDPSAQMELLMATRWHVAVSLLADLKAVEAMDVLVRNICVTGQPVIIVSIHHRPVLGSIIRIGRQAVPRLVEALYDDDPSVRREVAAALGEIGGSKAKKALEQAFEREKEESTMRAISSALTHIAYSNIVVD